MLECITVIGDVISVSGQGTPRLIDITGGGHRLHGRSVELAGGHAVGHSAVLK